MNEAVRAWIESVADEPIAALEPVGFGSSNQTWFVTLAGGRRWVVRIDTGDGPTAGTELSLKREATMIRALGPHGVRVPGLIAVDDAGTTMLMERAPGTHRLPKVDIAERATVVDDYIDTLAELHRVDVTSLSLPGYHLPTTPESHARNEVELWRRIYEIRRRRRDPLLEFTFALLHLRAPTTVAKTVVCHGDVGPGNFTIDQGRVTALVDWEFTHIGDPMDDLAWWAFRGHDMAGHLGDLGSQLEHWSKATGLPLDRGAIEYYRALVMLRWLVCSVATVDSGGPGIDRSVHNQLIALIGALLPQSLARILQVDLDPTPQLADEGVTLGVQTVLDTMRQDLTEVIAPAIEDPLARQRAAAMAGYLSHLEKVNEIGAQTMEANAADLAQLLGNQRPGRDDASKICEQVDQLAEETPEGALKCLARVGDRTARLWPEITGRAAGGLVRLR
jgi:aminoglycoside phosphotransferase (APT) family kinase protein